MREPVDWPTLDPLAHRRRVTPDRTAIVDAATGAARTYRELDAAVDRARDRLERALPDPGSGRIAVLSSTRAAFFLAAHAVLRGGNTLVPLNVRLTESELADQAGRADVDAVVCERDTEGIATALGGAVYSLDDPGRECVEALDPDRAEGSEATPARWDRDDVAVVMFTSGTTGRPKGVRLTLGNLVASAAASAFRLGVAPGDRWLCCLPAYHMGGLAPAVRTALYGTTLVVQRGFEAAATARALADTDATGVSLVPTQLRRLLEEGWTPPASLRTVLLGGAPAGPDLLERARAAGVPVCPTYGLTETASQVATARPGAVEEHPEAVGQPLVFTDVTVVDEGGTPVGDGRRGELVVEGPTVTPGYLDAERTAAAFGEHGLHTGDVGVRTADGRLRVVGRLDDVIISGGENVHPSEVARALADHPEVADVAVVGLPDEEWGERVGALVVPESGALTPEAVRRHARSSLAEFKRPKTVALADTIPRTPSGTVDREAVRERLGRE